MKKFCASFALLSIFICSSLAHVCDICNCYPSRYDVFSITCNGQSTEHLHLTSSMMIQIEATKMVTIRDYASVSIETRSFSQLQSLETLGIQNSSHLYLAAGAFEYLNSLSISNVKDISFGKMAFMGARGVKHVVISYSNITELPIYSLYDVKDVEMFSLIGVNIGRVRKNAVNIKSKSITITNTTVNYVESNGFNLTAERILMKKSQFNVLEQDAINMTSYHETRLIDNDFYAILELNLTTPYAEIYKNYFVNFDTKVVAHVQMPRIYDNIIQDTNLEQLLYHSNHKDFYDNEFECKCGMNLRNASRHSENYEILRKNYCLVNNCTLSLFDFEVESLPRCMSKLRVEANDFCTPQRMFKMRTGEFNSTEKENNSNFTVKIQPRFLAFDEGENNFNSANGILVGKISILLSIVMSVVLFNLS